MVTAVFNPGQVRSAEGVSPIVESLPFDGRVKVALIIPTFREAGNISVLIGRVRAVMSEAGVDYEIVVVDDDSEDGIEGAVADAGGARVRLLVRKGKRGLSGAVLHGWMHTDAAIVGVMDADLQHPPELLPELISEMARGCDVAIGSRYAAGGKLGSWGLIRKMVSAAAVWVTWPIQRPGVRVKDPMSGFFFVRRDCLRGIAFQEEGFKLLLEILVRGRVGSVHEVPFVFGSRLRGGSKANLGVALNYARLLARLYKCRFGWNREASLNSARMTSPLQSGQRHPQNEEGRHSHEEDQGHADARFAIDLGDEVACADVESNSG